MIAKRCASSPARSIVVRVPAVEVPRVREEVALLVVAALSLAETEREVLAVPFDDFAD